MSKFLELIPLFIVSFLSEKDVIAIGAILTIKKTKKNMENMSLIYHFLVVVLSMVMFFIKITARHEFTEFVLKSLNKLASFYCMIYAAIQIFKYFGLQFQA